MGQRSAHLTFLNPEGLWPSLFQRSKPKGLIIKQITTITTAMLLCHQTMWPDVCCVILDGKIQSPGNGKLAWKSVFVAMFRELLGWNLESCWFLLLCRILLPLLLPVVPTSLHYYYLVAEFKRTANVYYPKVQFDNLTGRTFNLLHQVKNLWCDLSLW